MSIAGLETYSFEGSRVVRSLKTSSGSRLSAVENLADSGQPPAASWWQSFIRGGHVFADLRSVDTVPLRCVDVFSGCGGLTLGASQAAIAAGRRLESIAAIDVDGEALAVHASNFGTKRALHCNASGLVDWHISSEGAQARFAYEPEILNRELQSDIGNVDLLLAGPPCQGHSNLNNRTRREDPRNLLYLTAVALGVGLRAKAIVIENVPDVISDRDNVVETARAVLRESGYDWLDSGVLALHRLGGAQTRKRFFLVANKRTSRGAVRINQIAEALAREPTTLGWAIGDLLHDPSNDAPECLMDTVPTMSSENFARVRRLFEQDLYELPDDSRPDSHKNGHSYPSVYGRLWWDRPAMTLTTGFLTPGRGRHIHPLRPRVVTPHEAARIQTFPDSFRFVLDPASAPTRTALQKWIGDAVPPLLAYAATLPVMLTPT